MSLVLALFGAVRAAFQTTRIWHSRTWRSANNSPYSAIARGDLGSVSSTAPSGCRSLNAAQFGEDLFTSSAPKRSDACIRSGFADSGPGTANAGASVGGAFGRD